ncbi:hypothetical protein LTR08_004513 [Meristemomyces frigidus]|nr:hypothetical protein LTR08_004513 [Meristemomyces frigidus]
MTTASRSAAVAPRLELSHTATHETGFDLADDPSTFEGLHARPCTTTSTRLQDSPTLGTFAERAASPPLGSASATATATIAGAERHSRFVEMMASGPGAGSETAAAAAGASSSSASASSSPPERVLPQVHSVNPATIPIRTSSTHAVASGDKGKNRRHSSNPGGLSSPKSPGKHTSLGSVPEERRYSARRASAARMDEREWMADHRRRYTPLHETTDDDVPCPTTITATTTASRKASSPTLTAAQQWTPPSPFTPSSSAPVPTLNTPPPSTTPTPTPTPTLHHQPSASTWTAEKETILKAPFAYLEAHPGKDIRSQLITAFNAWLRVPPASLAIITSVVGMLHTASLLIDDVEDSSSLRRGVPVAHHIFGPAQTINSANYIYFCALKELMKLGNAELCVGIYTEELLNLHRGQGMEIFWRDTLTCPSEDDYLEMVGNKTGGLFRLAIKLMCAESPSHNYHTSPTTPTEQLLRAESEKTDYTPLANTIGTLFQILDDYLNLANPTYTAHKGLAEDLTEGKFSFPVIHSIRTNPHNLTILNILRQRTREPEVLRLAVGYMERETGSFGYTRRVLRGLGKRAAALVEVVEGSVGRGGEGGNGKGGGGAGGGYVAGMEGGGAEGVRAILERLRVDRHSRGSLVGV